MQDNSSEDYIIEVDSISKTFPNGVCALSDFSANIRRGEVVVVIGPSGSGKSTFLRCLNGLETIDKGSIVKILDMMDTHIMDTPLGIDISVIVKFLLILGWVLIMNILVSLR